MDLGGRIDASAQCGTITDADLAAIEGLGLDSSSDFPMDKPPALPPKPPQFSRHISLDAVFGGAPGLSRGSIKPTFTKSQTVFDSESDDRDQIRTMLHDFLHRARMIPNSHLKSLCTKSDSFGRSLIDDFERMQSFQEYISEKLVRTRDVSIASCTCSKFRVSESCAIFPSRLIMCSIRLCLSELLTSRIEKLVTAALNLVKVLDKNISVIELCSAPLFTSDLSVTASTFSKFEDSKMDSESILEDIASLRQSLYPEEDLEDTDDMPPSSSLTLIKSFSLPTASTRSKPRSSGKLSQPTSSTKAKDPMYEAVSIAFGSMDDRAPKWFVDELTKLLLDISDVRAIIGQKFAKKELLPLFFQTLLLCEKSVIDAHIKSMAVLLNVNADNCATMALVNSWPKLLCDLLLQANVVHPFEDSKTISDKTEELEELVEEEEFFEQEIIQHRKTSVLFSDETRAQIILTMAVAILKNLFLNQFDADLEKHIQEFRREINSHNLTSRQAKEIYKLFLGMFLGTISKQDMRAAPIDHLLKNSIPLCRQVLKYMCIDDDLENEISFHISRSYIPEDLSLATALEKTLTKLIAIAMLDSRVNKDISGFRDSSAEILSTKEFRNVFAAVEDNKKLVSELVLFFDALKNRSDKLEDHQIHSIAESLSVVIKKWGLRKEILRSTIVKKLVFEIQSSLSFIKSDIIKKADTSRLVKMRIHHGKEKDLLTTKGKLGI